MSPLRTAIRSFSPQSMPVLTRALYRRELTVWLLLPVMLGAVEGGVVGVFAKNAFGPAVPGGTGPVPADWLNVAVAILAAAPAFANVLSFVWAGMSLGRDKVRFLTGLQIAACLLVASIALAPRTPGGLVVVTCGAVGARLCWSGVVTIRATVWQANYPRAVRARMAGKLATVQAIVLATVGLAIGFAMRANENAYHVLYLVAAAIGLVGAATYSGMRVRGHRALRTAERTGHVGVQRPMSPAAMMRVLRDDPLFAKYMILMAVFGLGNLMVTPVLVIMLRDEFGFGYLGGILIAGTIPVALIPVSVPIWARLLDRVHILRFRAVHCWSFLLATLAYVIGGVLHMPGWMWAGSVLRGLAIGGGVLGWNLGHQDFAKPADASRYMGVHVTLTGVRGLAGPVLGVALYEWFSMSGRGGWVFAVCLALNVIGAAGFIVLARHRSVPQGRPTDVRAA